LAKVGNILGSDSASLRTSSGTIGNSLNIDSQALAVTPKSATLATALALVRLYSGNACVDSMWLRWYVKLPVVSPPVFANTTRRDSSLIFQWLPDAVADSFRVQSSLDRGLTWFTRTVTRDSAWVITLATAKYCTLTVTAIAPDGRESVPAGIGSTTRNPPAVPAFAATNTDLVNGIVTLQLNPSPAASDAGTIWRIGTATSSGPASWGFGSDGNLDSTKGSGTISANAGMNYFRIQAIRDGDTAVSGIDSVLVTRTAGAAPQMPSVAVARTLTKLTWSWNTSPAREYVVYTKIGGAVSPSDTGTAAVSRSIVSTGSYSRDTLSPGTPVGVLIYAKSTGTDSSGGLSVTPYNSVATTRVSPSSSDVGTISAVQSGTSLVWSWVGKSDIAYCVVNGTSITPASGNVFSYTGAAAPGTNTLTVLAYDADSLSVGATGTVYLPNLIGNLDTSSWEIRVSGSQWIFLDHTASAWATSSTAPASVRLTVNGTGNTVSLANAQAGESFALNTAQSSATAKLQYVWPNGDTSRTATVTASGLVWPTITGTSFVAAGTGADTLTGLTLALPSSGYSAFLRSHSVITPTWIDWSDSGSSTFSIASGTLANRPIAMGADSIQVLCTRPSLSTQYTDSLWTKVPVNRTEALAVTYRNGSAGTVKAVRIGGVTWMAQNLNYDIPDDSADVCYNNDPANCTTMGRLYTASQAWNLLDGNNAINHACDTMTGTSGCTISGQIQGVCPNGWHLPSSSEWSTIEAMYGAELLSGTWYTTTGTDAVGLNIAWSSNAVTLSDGTLSFDPFSLNRQSFWSSTQDGAGFDDGFFNPPMFYSHQGTTIYNDVTPRRQRVAYPVRCVHN
jgi:uncharacterized protein (TIGR02145 family)